MGCSLRQVGKYRSISTGVLVLAVAAGCSAGSPASVPAGPTYSCCRAADVHRDYRPGETLALRWIVIPAVQREGVQTPQVELKASLVGPFSTVGELKASPGATASGIVTFAAETVRPSGLAGEEPVSVIAIPSDAAAGYYNLITAVSEASGSIGGASVIRVIPLP